MESALIIDSVGLDYLPWVLWMHILSFLPVKSLFVARLVCRMFLAMIDDPNFITLHLRNFPANLHETRILTLKPSLKHNEFEHLLVDDPDIDLSEFIFHSTVCEILEVEGNALVNAGSSLSKWLEDLSCFNHPGDLCVMGSLDGLVLGVSQEVATLWNPSIKRSRQIPPPSDAMLHFNCMNLGLGFDVSCNDYKVLAIFDPTLMCGVYIRSTPDEVKAGAWVYSVKTGTWAVVGMPACRDERKMSEILSFKGGLVWIEGVKSSRGYYHHLVWFDFATEEYRYSWMPYPIKNNLWLPSRLVVLDGGSSMGVVGLDCHNEVSIWVMDHESGTSWTRLHNVGEGVFRIGAYRMEEMIWEYWTKGARPKVSLYDGNNNESYDSSRTVSYMGVYVESLVMLK